MVRGFSRRKSPTIGNFWVDMTRCMFYILLPIAFIFGIIFVGEGAVQTLAGTASFTDVLNNVSQTIARGPIGFMEAIKQLGTNGGGFLDQNSATPFENPTGLTNFLSFYLLLSIPVALTYTFGKMVGSIKHGFALLAVVIILFGVWVGYTANAEHQNNPALPRRAFTRRSATPKARKSASATPRPHSSPSPRHRRRPGPPTPPTTPSRLSAAWACLTGMMMGEVTPGGTGTGLYTLLIYAIIAVFIGGLMIGRTPEYLGKKIQAKEVKLAGLGSLVMPMIVLIFTAIAVSLVAGRAGPENAGPHGFTEILYALTSQGNNNGSAFGGLTGNTPFYNIIGGIDMLIGRFGIMIPAIALGGILAEKEVVPESLGTFRTDNGMFVGLTIGVILIIGGLTFFPAISLGPIVEQLSSPEVLLMTTVINHARQPDRPSPTASPKRGDSSTGRFCARH